MKENKYKDVLKGIVEIIRNAERSDSGFANICTYIGEKCPELENKDEKIRKKLIEYFKGLMGGWFPYSNEEIIAYLEKMKDFDEQLDEAYKKGNGVFFSKGYDAGYAEGKAFAKQELEKQNEKPTTISVDKMVGEFEDFKVISCGRIPSLAEVDAYRKGVTDALSKILIKEVKAISLGSKKAEGKLGEMIAASKEPAESGEDKELSHSQVSKKSEQVPDNLIEESYQQQADDLIDMVTKKSTWSEEDEYLLKWSLYNLQEIQHRFGPDFGIVGKCIDWIKSLKQRLS